MKATQWILLICLLIAQFNADFCRASPTGVEEEDDIQNDDYGDYDEDESATLDSQPPKVAENAFSEPPFFEQQEIVMKAKPGDTVILNCDARNFAISNVAMWYKDSTLVANGQNAISNRVEVMKNNSLKLTSVTAEDADDYYCAVLPQNVRQHTKLTVGARLSILCDDRDVTDRSQTFKQGDRHTLLCQTFLPNKTDIKWSFNGQRFATSAEDTANGVIVLENVDEENVGLYQCLGDDGSSDPPHGMLTIDVQYSPKVSTHRHHVNTQEGGSAQLYCDYRANPIAISFFIKDGKTLTLSDKYSIKNSLHKQHNRTTLMIKHVDENDLGEYLCHVENSIGSNEVRVQLSYNPETPQFENMTIDGNMVTMHWLVRSLQPLSEAMLDYKMTGSFTWSTVSMIKTHRHEKESGIWKITHQMELTPGLWHARVKTKNTHDWSHFSPEHDFTIEEASSVIDEGAVPPEDLVRAGFGPVGGDSKNTACLVSLLPGLIVAAFSISLLQL
ncbi:immunoglobulin superfamily member 10 [Drosophila innubila]|uniref:immunoglobulin superfamily member 10 n=1 Tax=Drosophila innubila TaxID=198719 RepID=UPI00148E358D|nr:immunoglobulin superfamily member 10 [Drosophila innubila]XP_034479791.1 immunoglobulin superfamily member 10 [Drosophila innubila]XP_034479792.1 immunoglobulin superfamily member 10 [Drosophila innubila]